MSDPAWAAYDPLFWAHHCMVDRAWRIWQRKPLAFAQKEEVRVTILAWPSLPSKRKVEGPLSFDELMLVTYS